MTLRCYSAFAKTSLALLVVFSFCSENQLRAQEPQIVSLFPLGGQQGTTFQVKIRGKSLEGAYGVWFDCDRLKAEVEKVEEIDLEEKEEGKPKKGFQVSLKVTMEPGVKIGAHLLRLVTPQGVSGPLTILASSQPNVLESEAPHHAAGQAQPLNFPVVVNGKTSMRGELDYYALNVAIGQELRFEVLTGSGLLEGTQGVYGEPELILYEFSGSWFDPHRIRRLEVKDESIGFKSLPKRIQIFMPRLTHHFNKEGRYLAVVGALEGRGGPDYSYQLRIVPAKPDSFLGKGEWFRLALAHPRDTLNWQEREFNRRIESDRLQQLRSRTVLIHKNDESKSSKLDTTNLPDKALPSVVEPAGMDLSASATVLTSVLEEEPNDSPRQALPISIPSIVEGTIGRPGDVDYFKFHVKSGQKLAFEIETGLFSQYFSPRLGVWDGNGQEVLTNIYRRVGGDGDDWIKTVEPKTVYAFDKDGEYYLQIRDLTTRRGTSDFRYRILIRPQIPHVGEIAVREDRINLVPGEAKKITVVTQQEEGFDGDIAISVENLSPGVQAYPAAAVDEKFFSEFDEPYEERGQINKERFRPQRLTTAIVLLAAADASATLTPRLIQLVVRPVVQGKPGLPLIVHETALMVLKRPGGEQAVKQDASK